MGGGLLNLISVGNANQILTGDPKKTFFRCTYAKYTNFGLQRFNLPYEGAKDMNLTSPSQFTFRIRRYADLLVDMYLTVDLPDIYSPIYSPSPETNYKWVGYDFRWIDHIGMNIIQTVDVTCGAALLQRYTGDYLKAVVDRDFSAEKKDLFDRMSGHVPELNDPANAFGRVNAYPNAFYTPNATGAEPSIRGRTLYIPINAWFTLDSRCAFPLISLQYNELVVTVTLRPVSEWFRVRDVLDTANQYPYIQPDFNQEPFQMYRFLQTPPGVRIDTQEHAYENQTRMWNANIQLLCTYAFLSKDEQVLFAKEDQEYLVKDTNRYFFENVVGSSRLKLENSSGMVHAAQRRQYAERVVELHQLAVSELLAIECADGAGGTAGDVCAHQSGHYRPEHDVAVRADASTRRTPQQWTVCEWHVYQRQPERDFRDDGHLV